MGKISLYSLVILHSCAYLLSSISTYNDPKDGLITLHLHHCSKLLTLKKKVMFTFLINFLFYLFFI